MAGGNSSLARSLRARAQLRDRKGRWVEMGAKIRFLVDGIQRAGNLVSVGSDGRGTVEYRDRDGSIRQMSGVSGRQISKIMNRAVLPGLRKKPATAPSRVEIPDNPDVDPENPAKTLRAANIHEDTISKALSQKDVDSAHRILEGDPEFGRALSLYERGEGLDEQQRAIVENVQDAVDTHYALTDTSPLTDMKVTAGDVTKMRNAGGRQEAEQIYGRTTQGKRDAAFLEGLNNKTPAEGTVDRQQYDAIQERIDKAGDLASWKDFDKDKPRAALPTSDPETSASLDEQIASIDAKINDSIRSTKPFSEKMREQEELTAQRDELIAQRNALPINEAESTPAAEIPDTEVSSEDRGAEGSVDTSDLDAQIAQNQLELREAVADGNRDAVADLRAEIRDLEDQKATRIADNAAGQEESSEAPEAPEVSEIPETADTPTEGNESDETEAQDALDAVETPETPETPELSQEDQDRVAELDAELAVLDEELASIKDDIRQPGNDREVAQELRQQLRDTQAERDQKKVARDLLANGVGGVGVDTNGDGDDESSIDVLDTQYEGLPDGPADGDDSSNTPGDGGNNADLPDNNYDGGDRDAGLPDSDREGSDDEQNVDTTTETDTGSDEDNTPTPNPHENVQTSTSANDEPASEEERVAQPEVVQPNTPAPADAAPGVSVREDQEPIDVARVPEGKPLEGVKDIRPGSRAVLNGEDGPEYYQRDTDGNLFAYDAESGELDPVTPREERLMNKAIAGGDSLVDNGDGDWASYFAGAEEEDAEERAGGPVENPAQGGLQIGDELSVESLRMDVVDGDIVQFNWASGPETYVAGSDDNGNPIWTNLDPAFPDDVLTDREVIDYMEESGVTAEFRGKQSDGVLEFENASIGETAIGESGEIYEKYSDGEWYNDKRQPVTIADMVADNAKIGEVPDLPQQPINAPGLDERRVPAADVEMPAADDDTLPELREFLDALDAGDLIKLGDGSVLSKTDDGNFVNTTSGENVAVEQAAAGLLERLSENAAGEGVQEYRTPADYFENAGVGASFQSPDGLTWVSHGDGQWGQWKDGREVDVISGSDLAARYPDVDPGLFARLNERGTAATLKEEDGRIVGGFDRNGVELRAGDVVYDRKTGREATINEADFREFEGKPGFTATSGWGKTDWYNLEDVEFIPKTERMRPEDMAGAPDEIAGQPLRGVHAIRKADVLDGNNVWAIRDAGDNEVMEGDRVEDAEGKQGEIANIFPNGVAIVRYDDGTNAWKTGRDLTKVIAVDVATVDGEAVRKPNQALQDEYNQFVEQALQDFMRRNRGRMAGFEVPMSFEEWQKNRDNQGALDEAVDRVSQNPAPARRAQATAPSPAPVEETPAVAPEGNATDVANDMLDQLFGGPVEIKAPEKTTAQRIAEVEANAVELGVLGIPVKPVEPYDVKIGDYVYTDGRGERYLLLPDDSRIYPGQVFNYRNAPYMLDAIWTRRGGAPEIYLANWSPSDKVNRKTELRRDSELDFSQFSAFKIPSIDQASAPDPASFDSPAKYAAQMIADGNFEYLENQPRNGAIGMTTFVRLPDGSNWLYKRERDDEGAFMEYISSQIAKTLGFKDVGGELVGGVDGGVVQPLHPGKAALDLGMRDSDVENDPMATRLGLLDVLIDNYDRHGGNWMFDPDTQTLYPIDFGLGDLITDNISNPGFFADRFIFRGAGQKINLSELQELAAKFDVSLKPLFEAAGRGASYNNLLGRLNAIISEAQQGRLAGIDPNN